MKQRPEDNSHLSSESLEKHIKLQYYGFTPDALHVVQECAF